MEQSTLNSDHRDREQQHLKPHSQTV